MLGLVLVKKILIQAMINKLHFLGGNQDELQKNITINSLFRFHS